MTKAMTPSTRPDDDVERLRRAEAPFFSGAFVNILLRVDIKYAAVIGEAFPADAR